MCLCVQGIHFVSTSTDYRDQLLSTETIHQHRMAMYPALMGPHDGHNPPSQVARIPSPERWTPVYQVGQ
jgi:hypothetical protein